METSTARLDPIDVPTRHELKTAALGGLLGGLAGSIVLLAGTHTIQLLAGVVGFEPTVGNGWATYLILTVGFGVAFAGVVIQFVDRYVAFVVSLTSRSDLIRGAVMPLTNRFGMRVVVTTAMGVIYGLVLGLLLVVVVIPLRFDAVAFPHLEPISLLGFLLYGFVLGSTYGTKVAG